MTIAVDLGHKATKQTNTSNCVYETLYTQPLACPPSCSPGNLLTILLQLTKSEATSLNIFEISLLEVFDVQICKGH